ncbi:flagellin FljK [soil metagenome]
MSLNSVNTNVGAMIALQSLNAINQELGEVQNRISTGLRVASPKDNPAIWAIAQRQRSEVSGLEAVKGSLQRGQSVAQLAIEAGESISDLLGQMKDLVVAASDPSITAADKAALDSDYVSMRRRIDTIASAASFGGANLISSGSTGQIRALADTTGQQHIDVNHVDLSTTGATLSGLPANLSGAIASTEIGAMSTAIDQVNAAVGVLGTGAKSLDTHLTFIGKLQDTMEASIGRMVDADIPKEAARLQSLQVRQQLAILSLGIANNAPSILLQLFQRR